MFAVIEFSRNAQRALCLLMSAAVVAAILSLGAYGANAALHEASYTVTVQP